MNVEEAIKGIIHYREQIHAEHMWSDPVNLSEVMSKLAVFNAYLADNIATLHKEATDKAYAVFSEATSEGVPVTKAEMMSRGESTVERETYEKVNNIYRSTDKLISIIQSRLKVIENQFKREGEA